MDKVIQKSLHYSVLDGIFASIMLGCSETFIGPYALAMGAGPWLIGLLAALPGLAGALIQVRSAVLAERFGSRMAVIGPSVLFQAIMWLPVIAVPYLFRAHPAVWLIIFYTVLITIGLIGFPTWSSLMADHVSENNRGKFFGWRNRICGIVNISSMFLAGLVLYLVRKTFPDAVIVGFTIIFSIAFIARIISWYYLVKMYEPKLAIRDEHRFTMRDFLKRLPRSNFGRFVIFVALINFSVFLVSPFFAVYLLQDLKFNYLVYTVIQMTATLTIFVTMTVWGAHADHVGNRRVLRLTSYFIPFVPMLWIVSHNPFYLIAVQFAGGFFWAGFNLSVSNFIYDAVTPEKRTRCIAYFNVVNGVAIFFGAITGGVLAKHMPPLFGYRLLSLFLLSGVLRLMVMPLCATIREVRKVKHVSSLELFYSIMTAKSPASFYSVR